MTMRAMTPDSPCCTQKPASDPGGFFVLCCLFPELRSVPHLSSHVCQVGKALSFWAHCDGPAVPPKAKCLALLTPLPRKVWDRAKLGKQAPPKSLYLCTGCFLCTATRRFCPWIRKNGTRFAPPENRRSSAKPRNSRPAAFSSQIRNTMSAFFQKLARALQCSKCRNRNTPSFGVLGTGRPGNPSLHRDAQHSTRVAVPHPFWGPWYRQAGDSPSLQRGAKHSTSAAPPRRFWGPWYRQAGDSLFYSSRRLSFSLQRPSSFSPLMSPCKGRAATTFNNKPS